MRPQAKIRLRLAILALAGLFSFTPSAQAQNPITPSIIQLNGACFIRTGSGSPEAAVTGSVCDIFLRTDGGASTIVYAKESGAGTNTGWVPLASGGSGAPTTATYITQTADGGLSAEQALAGLSTGLMFVTTTTGVITSKAPTDDNVLIGNGTDWELKALSDCTDTGGNHLNYTAATNTVSCGTSGGGGATHVILDSAVHTDTLTGTVVRGDLIVGNSTPKWAKFAKCTSTYFLNYSATDPQCYNLFGTQNAFTASQEIDNVANGLILKSQFADSPGGFVEWQDSSAENAIRIISGQTSPAGSLEVYQVNTDNGSGSTQNLMWRWLGQNGGGNVEHTPRGSAVITAAANAYGYWLKPAWTEAASGVHALVAGIRIDTPSLTNGSATTTETAALYIQGASSQGVSNYAIHTAAGAVRFDGPFTQSTAAATTGAANTTGLITKTITAIADNTATDLITVTIPNAAHAAVVHVTVLGSIGAGGAIGAFECSATLEGNITVARTAGVDTVATASTAAQTSNSCVAGATTITLAYSVTAMTGLSSAQQTFTIQGTITKGGGSSANHQAVVSAYVVNSNASGVTIQ